MNMAPKIWRPSSPSTSASSAATATSLLPLPRQAFGDQQQISLPIPILCAMLWSCVVKQLKHLSLILLWFEWHTPL
jgi:hypothetical protein